MQQRGEEFIVSPPGETGKQLGLVCTIRSFSKSILLKRAASLEKWQIGDAHWFSDGTPRVLLTNRVNLLESEIV